MVALEYPRDRNIVQTLNIFGEGMFSQLSESAFGALPDGWMKDLLMTFEFIHNEKNALL